MHLSSQFPAVLAPPLSAPVWSLSMCTKYLLHKKRIHCWWWSHVCMSTLRIFWSNGNLFPEHPFCLCSVPIAVGIYWNSVFIDVAASIFWDSSAAIGLPMELSLARSAHMLPRHNSDIIIICQGLEASKASQLDPFQVRTRSQMAWYLRWSYGNPSSSPSEFSFLLPKFNDSYNYCLPSNIKKQSERYFWELKTHKRPYKGENLVFETRYSSKFSSCELWCSKLPSLVSRVQIIPCCNRNF